MNLTNCTVCGAQTEVPFVPDGVRPVYCLPCLKRQTR
jgi:CxxC-x17-CxxC domain-containing protein